MSTGKIIIFMDLIYRNQNRTNMKQVFSLLLSVVILLGISCLQSCLKNDDYDNSGNFPNVLVTVKTNSSDGKVFFQLNDSTTILPTNMKTSPYGNKEVRALANIRIENGQDGHYAKTAYVNWVDSILTKNMAPNLGDENDKVYGKDPVEIVKDWTTVVEDGYITLRFRTYYGNGTRHIINLVKTDNPYEVMLRHNAKGDIRGVVRDGLVAFRLNDLPDTQGKTVELTLKWQSFSGMKSVKFKYRSRK